MLSFHSYSLTVPGTLPEVARSPLLPQPPRIIDPVNPANNVYLSGVSPPSKGRRRWDLFKERISSIDLSITATQILERD